MTSDIPVLAAKKALAQGDYALAWMHVSSFLQECPRHPEALILASQAAWAIGNSEAAVPLQLEALIRSPENGQVQAAVLKAFMTDAKQEFTLPEDPLAGLLTLMHALPHVGQIPLALGRALLARGRMQEAISALKTAVRLMPAHGLPTTLLGLVELGLALGPAPARPQAPASPDRRIAMSDLGERGRFGNQIVQYLFLLCHAKKEGLSLETPDWLGSRLLRLEGDNALGAPLPLWKEPSTGALPFLEKAGPSLAGRDISGYFNLPPQVYRPWKEEIQAALTPSTQLAPRLHRLQAAVSSRGKTLVALHLRRADQGKESLMPEAPAAWYLDWLKALWPRLDAPVLYLASNRPGETLPDFAAFDPLSERDLSPPLAGAEFIDDFMALSQAQHLALSPSTFSLAAALAARSLKSAAIPDFGAQCLVPVDPWMSPPFIS
ncbi:MAG: hypothetical protein HQL45_02715 [Alphaproteobacteria bacterium]|nr:hypothetical protein [Alphaproteobacteria bacterium]